MAEESGMKAERTLTIPQGMVSSLLVRVETGISPVIVGDEIRKRIPGTRTITPSSLLTMVTLHIAGITKILYRLSSRGHAALHSAAGFHLCDCLP